MSGEADVVVGALALPFIAIAGAGYLIGKIGEASINGAVALHDYHKQKQYERDLILDEVSGSLRNTLLSLNQVTDSFNADYEKMINNTAENISSVSKSFSAEASRLNYQNIAQYQERVKSVSKEMSAKFESDFANIQKNYADVASKNIDKLKTEIKRTFESQAAEIAQLSSNLEAKKKYCRDKADEAIKSTKEQLDYIKNNTDRNSSFSGKINLLEMSYNNMLDQYNRDMYEASYAMAENIKYTALDVFYDMVTEKNEMENYRTMLFFELKKLSHLVEEKSDIEFEYEESIIKASIFDYSEGLIEGFKKSLDEYYEKVENAKSIKELKVLYDEVVNEMTPSFVNIWSWSAKNLENAYLRKDIGMTIVDTLEEQNFTMTESGYKGDRDTNDFYIKFRHNFTQEEILIILKPDDKPKKVDTSFEIHQLTDNVSHKRQEDIRLDIVRGVSEYYETKQLSVKPCLESSIGIASRMKDVSISDIKNAQQKRSPLM